MEKYKKGGYTILDLESSTIYADSVKALDSNKPVVVYDGTNKPYFADTITLDGTNVVITKGGKTITIANDNTISSKGNVLTIMENIVDLDGRLRFVEGEGTISEISGVTVTYNKWSLSGTHLMIVISGTIADTTALVGQTLFAQFNLPEWILNKINPVVSSIIETKTATLYANDYTTQTLGLNLIKLTDAVKVDIGTSLTLTADRNFKVQFDLLIDAD